MVDVGQVREFDRFGRQHGSVKHYVVILDAGHVQSCIVRAGLDSDIALSPADHPKIFVGNSAADFGVAGRKILRHFEITRRSLTRFRSEGQTGERREVAQQEQVAD